MPSCKWKENFGEEAVKANMKVFWGDVPAIMEAEITDDMVEVLIECILRAEYGYDALMDVRGAVTSANPKDFLENIAKGLSKYFLKTSYKVSKNRTPKVPAFMRGAIQAGLRTEMYSAAIASKDMNGCSK